MIFNGLNGSPLGKPKLIACRAVPGRVSLAI